MAWNGRWSALHRLPELGVPTAFATAGFSLALIFIFIDPCAGRHLLLLLRQKK
jgi:hypothetical protein